MRPRATIAAVGGAVVLAGCGIQDPNTQATPASEHAPTGARTPAGVEPQRDPRVRIAVTYTLTQATWTADTYVAQKGRLAELAIGPARAQLTVRGQSPAAVARQLKAAGSSSSASLLGVDGPNSQDEVVVAYKATATGPGRSSERADYRIAHVTLTRHRGVWLVVNFAIAP